MGNDLDGRRIRLFLRCQVRVWETIIVFVFNPLSYAAFVSSQVEFLDTWRERTSFWFHDHQSQ